MLLTLVAPTPADAKPTTSILDASAPAVDVSFACGAAPGTVTFEQAGSFRVTEFTNRQGEIIRVRIQFKLTGTMTGPNGTATQKVNGPDILTEFDNGFATGKALGRNLWRLPDGSSIVGFAGQGEITYFGQEIVSFTPMHGIDGGPFAGFIEACQAVA